MFKGEKIRQLDIAVFGNPHKLCFDSRGNLVRSQNGLEHDVKTLKAEISKLKAIVAEVTNTVYGGKK